MLGSSQHRTPVETAMATATQARVRYEDNLFACPYTPEDVLDEDHLPTTDL